MFLLLLITQLEDITAGERRRKRIISSLWKKNVKEGELCDNLAGYYLGWGGLTDSLQKEQCRRTVRTILYTKLKVQRPETLITNR